MYMNLISLKCLVYFMFFSKEMNKFASDDALPVGSNTKAWVILNNPEGILILGR